jgi:bacillithiol biosynthesis cysteine-adding enzyme BshC
MLGAFPFADDVLAAVEEAYRPGATMGEGFHALLRTLCKNLDLIFVDPLDPEIRKLAAPFLTQALRAAPELKARLLERTRELTAAGYHAQVHVEAKTSLFFLLDRGERLTLRRKDSEYADLADRAADVSPNALLRPVMQDYLLPTIAYVGGPGELAYLAQSQVIYESLLGRMPIAMSRNGLTLIDSKTGKLLTRYGLTAARTFVHPDALRERIASTLIPESIRESIKLAASEVERATNRLKAELEQFDPTLAAAMTKSGGKIGYQMEKMRRKTEREAMRRDQRATADANYISAMLFPHRHLQERFYSILPFLAHHGMDLVDRIHDTIELDCPDHRVFIV